MLTRAYVDQLTRNKDLSTSRTATIMTALNNAEHANGAARKNALTLLGSQIDGDANGSSDGAKVRMLSKTVHDLANAAQ